MGERLDNAIAGAAGASLGSAIGGAIGTAALPIPFVGTFLGGTIGAAVGDWAGKEIYKKLSGQITQINPSPQLPDPPPRPGTRGLGGQINQVQGQVSGGNADFWTLAAIAALENSDPQGQADVAQAIYNRASAGLFPGGRSIKNVIIAPSQYSPVNESDPSKWAAIVDEATAIAAVASHSRGGVNAARMVSNAAQNILNSTLQKNAADYIGGRTDFNSLAVYPSDPSNAISVVKRHGHRFGFWVGSGSISYGQSNPGPAGIPNLSTSTSQPAPVLPGPDGRMPTQASPSTPLIGAGKATFGSTGNTDNAKKWVHGHFQDNNRNALLNNTFPVVKRLLEQGVSVVITGGGDEELNRNMSDSQIKQAISRGIDRHSNRARGYFAVDVSVPEGTKVPVPLQDIRWGGRREGIRGVIPGTNTFIGHLAPGSRSATAAELAQALRQQASYDQRGGTIVVPAPVIGGGGGQMIGGGGGGIMPIGISKKELLNSYYQAQLIGFLYKQG